MFPPARIVCLTEETVETLYLLGEEDRIVGVSGYACVRRRCGARSRGCRPSSPPTSRRFSRSSPIWCSTFSDLQADIAAELIRRNVAVHAFNQRDIAGIFAMIRTLGALVGATGEGRGARRAALETRLAQARAQRGATAAPAAGLFRGMGRADDLRHRLGLRADRDRRRRPTCSRRSPRQRAPRSASSTPDEVIAAAARHHHRLVVRQEIRAREGRGAAGLRRHSGRARAAILREIKSPLILQPGPPR